jgi:hypothetical protein
MAHYAFLDKNNIVIEVIVGVDETQLIDGLDPETWYGNFRGLTCKRTSYNGNIRGKYAGLGDTYNVDEDIFIVPQPYPSWTRKGSIWEAPIAYPTGENHYAWDEDLGAWVEAEIK